MRWEFVRLFARTKKNFSKAFSDLWTDLKDSAYELFVGIPRDIKRFFVNLWAYKSVLWSDRDWDHAYILKVLLLKIRRTKEHIGEHKRHTNWKKDVQAMQKAEDIISAILDGSSANKIYEEHDKKWGPAKHYFVPVPGSNSSYMRSDRPNIKSPKDRQQEQKEYKAVLRKAHNLENREWSSLWKHLDKHMRNWWD